MDFPLKVGGWGYIWAQPGVSQCQDYHLIVFRGNNNNLEQIVGSEL
jgi:hypothetical protein